MNFSMIITYFITLLLQQVMPEFAMAAAIAEPSAAPLLVSGLEEVNLTSIMLRSVIHQPEIIDRALRVTQAMQHAPTCYKRAVLTLVQSCGEIDGPGSEKDPTVNHRAEEAKKLFGARLAVCEISEGNGIIPKECKIMLPINGTESRSGWMRLLPGQTHAKSDVGYDPPSERETAQCIAALHGVGQFWTSYSNAKQSALSVCQVSRNDNQKEIILNVYNALAESFSSMPQALNELFEQLFEMQSQFDHSIRQLQAKIKKDMEVQAHEALGIFAKLSEKLFALFQETDKKAKQTSEEAGALYDMTLASYDVVASAKKQMSAAGSYLESMNSVQVPQISSKLTTMLDKIDFATQRVVSIQEAAVKIQEMEKESLQNHAMVAGLQETLANEMSTSHGRTQALVEHLEDTVNILPAKIEDAINQGIKQGQSAGTGSFLRKFSEAAVILCVVMIILHQGYKGYLLASTLFIFVLFCSIDLDHIRTFFWSQGRFLYRMVSEFLERTKPTEGLKTIGANTGETEIQYSGYALLTILGMGIILVIVAKRYSFGRLMGLYPLGGHQVDTDLPIR